VGNVVAEGQVSPTPIPHSLPRLHVIVSSDDEAACPESIEEYMVSVTNDSSYELEVGRGDVVLGPVQAQSTATFGPLTGLWDEEPFPGVRNSQGGDEQHGDFRVDVELDYDLGDMPTYKLWVQPGWQE